MKKRILSLLLALSVSASSMLIGGISTVSAAGALTGETKHSSSEIVYNGKNTGVTFTEIETSGSSVFGLNKIKVVEFDLANRNLEVKAINHGDKMTSMSTTSAAAQAYSNANSSKVIAAINGDLWMTSVHSNANVNTNGTFTIPRGMLIIDGEIWSTPQIGNENLEATNSEKGSTTPPKFAFGVTSNYQPLVGIPDAIISITNNTKEATIEADGLNRLPADNSLIVYNDRVSDSFALADAVEVEITVDNDAFKHGGTITGTVKAVYASGKGGQATISNNVIVLTARGSRAEELSEYAVGDQITISTEITADTNATLWQSCQQAVGGHIPAIINGSKGSHPESGYPSSIIGYDDDGKVMMVVVDGRQSSSVGLNGDSVYQFCTELGLNSAFYLDGGGSATMVTVSGSNYIVRNSPSDGSERTVINSIAVCWNDTQRAAQGAMDHIYNVNDGTYVKNVTSVGDFSYDGAVNKLMNDVVGQALVDVNGARGQLVVDLNGHTWTNDAQTLLITSANNVYIYDSSLDKNGKMVSTGSDCIDMGQGKLHLKDISLSANGSGSDALYINGGNVLVENCTLSAVKAGIDVSNGSEADAGIPAVIKVVGGIFNVHPNAEARNCAIELRNKADKDNISIEGDIKFRVNTIISRSENTAAIKDSITIGAGSTATFTDGTPITNGDTTWNTATIKYVYENATTDDWYAWWECDFESAFYDSVANTTWVTGNTTSSEGNEIRSVWSFQPGLGDPKGSIKNTETENGNYFTIGGINAMNYDYEIDEDYSFSVDFNVGKDNAEDHMAGFVFDFGLNEYAHKPYYKLFEKAPSSANIANRYVGNSGIGISFNCTADKDLMYIYVLETEDSAARTDYTYIEYVVEFASGTFTGTDFANLKFVEDGATKYILLNDELVAYVVCSDARTVDFGGEGTTPGQCAVECYSKATIYDAKGVQKATTSNAIISVPYTANFSVRARTMNIDNIQLGLPIEVEVDSNSALPGDVNGDGKVTSMDATLIRRNVAGFGNTIDQEAADVNNDGKVTSMDATLIRRNVAGFGNTLV